MTTNTKSTTSHTHPHTLRANAQEQEEASSLHHDDCAPSPECPRFDLLDASMGLYLFHIGLPKDCLIWSASALLDDKYHQLVIDAHKAYLKCGATVITTNNYACTASYLAKVGKESEIAKLTTIAVRLANTARHEYISECAAAAASQQSGNNKNRIHRHQLSSSSSSASAAQAQTQTQRTVIRIAGSVPPLTESYQPDQVLSEQDALFYYSQIVKALVNGTDNACNVNMDDCNESQRQRQCGTGTGTETETGIGIDLFLCETFTTSNEAVWALTAILCNGLQGKEIWISFSLQENGHLRSNESMNDVILRLEPWMNRCNLKRLSMNCCTPESIDNCLDGLNSTSMTILEKYDIYLGIYPNGSAIIKQEWSLEGSGFNPVRYELTPVLMYNEFYSKWLRIHKEKRIAMLGGCCNLEPRHIQYLFKRMQAEYPQLVPSHKKTNDQVSLSAKL